MQKFWVRGALAMALAMGAAGAAQANGLVAEAGLARVHGGWGGEFGAGYEFSGAGFTLRPLVGVAVYDRNDDTRTRLFGKAEATYTLPASLEFGLGARFTSDKTRGYALVSLPLAPAVRVRLNAGDGYFAVGGRLSF